MTIHNRSGEHVSSLEWRYTRNRNGTVTANSRSTPVKQAFTDWRDIRRVDPDRRFYHGFYQREGFDLQFLPYVQGTLSYEDKTTTNKSYYSINLFGSGFGYVVPKCRFLYEDEKSKKMLINNCIKGALDQSVDLATFIAELDKTGSLLADSASRIANAAGMVRKGQFTRAARALKIQKPKGAERSKSFANNMLEYQYGWMPIVTDMAGALKHLARMGRDLTVKAKSRFTSTVPLSDLRQVQLESQAAFQHRFLVTWRANSTWVRHEQVQLLFWLNSGFWDQMNRLGFLNPGQIAYQTIPGSFLLDWFSNLGDLISSLSLGLTLDYATGSYVEFHRNAGTLEGTPIWADTTPGSYKYTKVESFVNPTSYMDFKVKREVIPWTDVAVSFALSAPLSFNKAATAAALVRQQYQLFK